MAKTVDQFSTIENFRTKYNELAVDVGELSGLRTESTTNVVDALNSLEDKSFFFQEFQYVATASQTVFSGNDSDNNSLVFRSGRIQVFKNTDLLILGTDYSIGGVDGNKHTEITLNVGASVGDIVSIFAYTGSYIGSSIGAGGGEAGQFTETAINTIYNKNSNGVILNGSATGRTTSLSTSAKIEFDSNGTGVYSQEDITLANGKNFVECDADYSGFEILEQCYEDSEPLIPLYFILSPGSRVNADVDKLAAKMGKRKGETYHNISLGQGQDKVAEERLRDGVRQGHWIFLQNVHFQQV